MVVDAVPNLGYTDAQMHACMPAVAAAATAQGVWRTQAGDRVRGLDFLSLVQLEHSQY